MVTLKDIAAEAGVSIMTVSNVINGNHSKVSKKTIEKIEKIIQKYNYVPNLTARSLTAKSSKIIGVIVPIKGSFNNLFKDPYISELFGIIQNAVRENGYYLMVRSVKDVSDISALLKNWNMDGAIFLMPDYDNLIYSILKENKLPMVFLDSYSKIDNIISVGINDYKGGYIATRYLINNGHRKILFAGPCHKDGVPIPQIIKRLEGYKDALLESNIEFNESLIVDVEPNYEVGINLGRSICNKEFDVTAVFTTADIMGIGIIEGAKLNGKIVPNDLSVIGFDNLLPSVYVTPKLTTISQDIESKATKAVNLLIEYIENGSVSNNKITLDVELVERQSVGQLSNLK
ncbi:MAG: LacI family transcriptional regulator [Clostridium beijerinckii]|nr:LacI family transcriptional regulator [Clostridium beijerinckii]